MSEIQIALFFSSVISVSAGGYCQATSNQFYCEYGCCGNSCCPNEVAIGVGTTFGALVLLIIAGGVFICCIQRRYSPKEEVKFTKDGFTQYEKIALKKQEKVEEEEKDVELGEREATTDDTAPKEPV
uniref:Cysteine and tyrosine-rich protein 1 n=1 Tax=Magallana gigas TaxID=29159 RepID=K1PVL1_MAGGI